LLLVWAEEDELTGQQVQVLHQFPHVQIVNGGVLTAGNIMRRTLHDLQEEAATDPVLFHAPTIPQFFIIDQQTDSGPGQPCLERLNTNVGVAMDRQRRQRSDQIMP
jgi:hypothetical protein